MIDEIAATPYDALMQHQSLFVFDIETIPDTAIVPALTGVESADVGELRTALENYHLNQTEGRNGFPRQPFHRVVAVSFLEASITRDERGMESYTLKNLASSRKDDEREVIKGVFDYLERIKPRLVSYNGRTFDVPVLKYRAMHHGVQARWFYMVGDKWNSYQSRYSADWHCDLLDVLSDFGASSRVKLDEVCTILGFPGKFGVDGSKVAEMYDNGQLQEIKDYCETDVLNTYLVYLRLMQHQGRISTANYNKALADAIHYLEEHSSARPHLAEFLTAWGKACNNNYMLDEVASA